MDDKAPAMRDLIRQSRAQVLAEMKEFGPEEVFRRRLRRLASDGDLAIIAIAIDNTGKELARLILSDLNQPELDICRGQLIGIRSLWRDLLNAGEVDSEAQVDPLPDDEKNPFATLTEEDPHPLTYLTEDQ